MLSVLAAAAGAAAEAGSDRLDVVAAAAADAAAATALQATTGQLPELARAGVVDAGGLGLHRRPRRARAAGDRRAGGAAAGTAAVAGAAPGRAGGPERGRRLGEQRLRGHVPAGRDRRRPRRHAARGAGGLGDAWRWPATGRGLERPRALQRHRRRDRGRHGGGPAAPDHGRAARRPGRATSPAAHAAVLGWSSRPGGRRAGPRRRRGRAGARLPAPAAGGRRRRDRARRRAGRHRRAARRAAARRRRARTRSPSAPPPLARRDGQEVAGRAHGVGAAGLAALAVHDPGRRAGDDVVAMAEAAAGTRTGGLLVAESEALTWVGRCAAR